MIIDLDRLWTLAPRAITAYKLTFEEAKPELWERFEINNALRMAHFLSQVLHESRGFTALIENLNYSAERLMAVWPSRFQTLESTEPYAHHPEALAKRVYAMRLGNDGGDDGWNYRGRGMLQITGRNNYKRVSKKLEIDLIANPGLLILPEYNLPAAACMWQMLKANPAADRDDVVEVTKIINGGDEGLQDRSLWLQKTRELV